MAETPLNRNDSIPAPHAAWRRRARTPSFLAPREGSFLRSTTFTSDSPIRTQKMGKTA